MKQAPPLKCKVRNVQLFKSRDFVWLLIHGKATKLGGWVRGRENEEEFGLFESASFPWFCFTIYMDKLVGLQIGQMVIKIQYWQISCRNRVCHLHKSKYSPSKMVTRIPVWNIPTTKTVFRSSRKFSAESTIACITGVIFSCVGAARKVFPDWSQKTMRCHSFNCFSIVWAQN